MTKPPLKPQSPELAELQDCWTAEHRAVWEGGVPRGSLEAPCPLPLLLAYVIFHNLHSKLMSITKCFPEFREPLQKVIEVKEGLWGLCVRAGLSEVLGTTCDLLSMSEAGAVSWD